MSATLEKHLDSICRRLDNSASPEALGRLPETQARRALPQALEILETVLRQVKLKNKLGSWDEAWAALPGADQRRLMQAAQAHRSEWCKG